MINDPVIELAGEQVHLLPERALFWPREQTLFVADTHWGKAATFRAAAIALPGGTTDRDLARLTGLLQRTVAQRLVVLGDLFHAKDGRTPRTLETITAWRQQHAALDMLLVRGNHDQRAGDPPAEWHVACVDEPHPVAPFALCHWPNEWPTGYTLAGHVHPAVELVGAGRQREKLACFFFGPRVGILPAFGSFTGTATLRPTASDRVFVIADDAVIAVQ